MKKHYFSVLVLLGALPCLLQAQVPVKAVSSAVKAAEQAGKAAVVSRGAAGGISRAALNASIPSISGSLGGATAYDPTSAFAKMDRIMEQADFRALELPETPPLADWDLPAPAEPVDMDAIITRIMNEPPFQTDTPAYNAPSPESYPVGEMRLLYRDLYNRMIKEFEPETYLTEEKLNLLLNQQQQEEFKALRGEMREINVDMAQSIRGMLYGHKDPAEMFALNNKINRLYQKMMDMQGQISITCDAINLTKKNMSDYASVTMGLMPAESLVWANPVPYNYSKFVLPRVEGFSPTAYDISVAVSPAAKKGLQKRLYQQMPQSSVRIALLNDSSELLDVYRTAQSEGLIPAQYQIDYYPNVDAFAAAHRNNPYDVVLTDWLFPGGGGDMVTKILRENNDATPVILHTAGKFPPDFVHKLYNKGYSAYAPVKQEMLVEDVVIPLRNYFMLEREGSLMPLLSGE